VDYVRLTSRLLAAAALVFIFEPAAHAQPSAILAVSATVRPSCRFVVETGADGQQIPAARVSCGRKALRSLRTSAGGMQLTGIAVDAPAPARASGELRFVVPTAVALVAARTLTTVRESATPVAIVTFEF
jgi:hypothetical protein